MPVVECLSNLLLFMNSVGHWALSSVEFQYCSNASLFDRPRCYFVLVKYLKLGYSTYFLLMLLLIHIVLLNLYKFHVFQF